ncbi:hypothetical protein [Flavobacterium sp.]|uniref:hypothetical protein n=1 Tax=Flavobacterium sp. TaxID=239 RepID=UPI00374FFBEC
MNKVVVNPENYQNTYLQYLNQCFPNWGNETAYNWVFERKVGENASDILLLKDENNEVIAGSSITYRIVQLEDKSSINIGIMTGSWTLPQARGKGCFSQIIEESKRICFSRNVPFLTAFVTESNASYRRLKEAGFYCKIADNIFSNEVAFSTNQDFSSVKIIPVNIDVLHAKYQDLSSHYSTFAYTKEEFKKQYANRLTNTQCISINQTLFLYEDTGAIIKLLFSSGFNSQDLVCFCDWMRYKEDKKVMFFLSDVSKIKIAQKANFHFVKGFLTIQKTHESIIETAEIFKNISINLGDKM